MEENFMVNLTCIEEKIKEAYKKSCHRDWSCLEDIKPLSWVGAFYTHHSIMEALLYNLNIGEGFTENDLHKWLRENCESFFGNGYRISNKKNKAKFQPDLWVIKDGVEIPVECKINEFTEKSLKQLNRYMEYYGSSKGIAVAAKLACKLPDNIRFIKYEWLVVKS